MLYPVPLRQATEELRRRIATRVTELTGVDVRQVDIRISWLTTGTDVQRTKEAAMSRHGQRSTRLRHRPSRAVPALIVGLLLLAAGVALVWLSITRLVNGSWPTVLQGPRDWLAGLAWNDPATWQIGTAAVVAGVILLLCAIIPGGYNAIAIEDSAPRWR